MWIRTPKPPLPEYHVTRCSNGPGRVRIALMRRAPLGDTGASHTEESRVVLTQRTFDTRVELFALESYAAVLERAAEHGNRGTLGCFVHVEVILPGTVRVTLYERWFHGKYLLCEQLAGREFDARRDDARAESVAYLHELRGQAAQRNHARGAAAEHGAEDATTARWPSDSTPAAEQLAQLLQGL
jgi:hypothetical protein